MVFGYNCQLFWFLRHGLPSVTALVTKRRDSSFKFVLYSCVYFGIIENLLPILIAMNGMLHG